MITAIFGLQNYASNWSAILSSPIRTMIATQLEEVVPLLTAAEIEARSGNYVALLLSYEGAPAFDSALTTHPPTSFPLLWAAVFSEAHCDAHVSKNTYSVGAWSPQITRACYDDAISEIRARIARGDTYQVNYSFPLEARFEGDPLSYFFDLCAAQGAHYSAFINLGPYQVLSLSPELFFERTGDAVRTKPMKGTVRRGRWPAEDNELATWLANSRKDRAENVMIVDLLRNDLGKVSIPGSVKVTSLFELERFRTVWQMTSTVESSLRPDTTLTDLLGALFPCGSITGAPKIRTMEIINQLESHSRLAYTGTIGLLRPGGDCIFNVAIRTVVIDSQTQKATFGVGGGITIDSTADREYEECMVKARFLEQRPASFALFESILLENGEYFLLERHLERLRNSADFFGFEFPDSEIFAALNITKTEHKTGKGKVKLVLSKDGDVSIDVSPIGPAKDLRIALATSPVDSNDPLLYHKTTQRDFYSTQLESRPDCNDLIFFNERGEVTESSVANVVVRVDGKLVTPPITSGLLAGTFRDQLIIAGEIEERVVALDELKSATEVFLINSVRKWIEVVLA